MDERIFLYSLLCPCRADNRQLTKFKVAEFKYAILKWFFSRNSLCLYMCLCVHINKEICVRRARERACVLNYALEQTESRKNLFSKRVQYKKLAKFKLNYCISCDCCRATHTFHGALCISTTFPV